MRWRDWSARKAGSARCEFEGDAVAVRRLPIGVNLSGRGTLTGRARLPARRECVLEANGVFPRLIGEGSGLREQRIARIRLRHLRVEKGYRVKAMADRQRSLPSLVRRLPDRYRVLHLRPDSRRIPGATTPIHAAPRRRSKAFSLQLSVSHLRVRRVRDEPYQPRPVTMAL